jgi:hypothetical protein
MDGSPRRRHLRDQRLRLTACIAAVSFAVLGGVVALLSVRAAADTRAEFERQGRLRVGQLAACAGDPLAAQDRARLQSLLSEFAWSDDVLEASIVDASGRVVASTEPNREGRAAPGIYRHGEAGGVAVHPAPGSQAGENAVLFVAAISSSSAASTATGSAAVRVSSPPRATAPPHLLFQVGTLLIVQCLVAGFVYWLLGPPLRSIAAVGGALTAIRHGELDTRLDPDRLGLFARLGVMINQLAATYEQIARRVIGTTDRLHAVTARLSEASSEMQGGSERHARAIEESLAQLGQIDVSVTGIAEEVGTLSRSTKEASGAVLQMGGSIDEVAHSMDALNRAVESSSSSGDGGGHPTGGRERGRGAANGGGDRRLDDPDGPSHPAGERAHAPGVRAHPAGEFQRGGRIASRRRHHRGNRGDSHGDARCEDRARAAGGAHHGDR